ncbi:hypothetical protein Pr1d_28300 [Bythopirellula goksoeyrii]|uniref:Uncharacterized protein n=1 Tax=Bythopirellula goksoeyrii TaxID=1400387 RepID=A0A5B9QCK1_9BACT|nr:hypothetical protein Pr1d_28300 [Bythopirellula goksoeyrii]
MRNAIPKMNRRAKSRLVYLPPKRGIGRLCPDAKLSPIGNVNQSGLFWQHRAASAIIAQLAVGTITCDSFQTGGNPLIDYL